MLKQRSWLPFEPVAAMYLEEDVCRYLNGT
jgi:hypothetical protein